MSRRNKSGARHLWAAVAHASRAAPALSVSEWADKYRRLSSEGSARPGKWRSFPFQIEPMDAANDPAVVEVVLDWAAQTAGKSEILLNLMGFFMHADPAPQLMAQPTVDLASSFGKDRISPMIRDCPQLRRLVKDPRARDSGNTLLSKSYPGGSLVLIGANSPAGLAGRPRRVILLDEVDRYPASAGTEGDPIALADKRAESFANCVKIKTSTPTIKGFSKIEKLIESSDYRKWHVRCPKCDAEQVLMWAQIKFQFPHPEIPETHVTDPERAYYECEHCKAALDDADRVAMVQAGKWKPTREFHGVRGYWLNGLNTLFEPHKGYRNRLHQFAAEFLKAKKDGREAMKTWVNTFLAETWEEQGETISPNPLMARRENYGPKIPRHCLVLIGKADIQGDRIEAEIEGFGIGSESWRIRYQIIVGPPNLPDVWKQLDEFFLQTFEHEGGATMKVALALVDSGYEQELVLQYTKPREGHRVYACKGVGTPGAPIVARGTRNNQARAMQFPIGANAAKDLIYGRLRIAEPGAGYCHYPVGFGFDEEWFFQLTAEKAVTRFHQGQAVRVYEKTRARNEALDLAVYGAAGLSILNPNMVERHKALNGDDAAERDAEAPPASRLQVPLPPAPVGPAPVRVSKRRPLGGFAIQ